MAAAFISAANSDSAIRAARIPQLARASWERGQAALDAGDVDTAWRWLDRAHRLAPHDPTFRLALAGAALSRDPAQAAALFAGLAERHDVREVWLGLATAHWRCGAAEPAVAALSRALSHHVAPQNGGWQDLATLVAPNGWCAIGGGGPVLVGGAGRVTVLLDDRPLRSSPLGILPPRWVRGRWLRVVRNGHDLVGSPIDIAALRRIEGIADWQDGEIRGWAWHPADPARVPRLLIQTAGGRIHRLAAGSPLAAPIPGQLLARPHGFRLTLPAHAGPFRVTDTERHELAGSPVHADAGSQDRPARTPPRTVPRQRGTAIVIPVYGDRDGTLACLDSVLAARPGGMRVIVVNDATSDKLLAAALDGLAMRRKIRLLVHAENRGFPASANAGFTAAGGRDVVLLNSDTLVAPGFVERLRAAAYAAPATATACPLSNDATILSYPDTAAANPMPDLPATIRLAALAARANGARTVAIPTPVGFCAFFRHDALAAVGGFRSEIFGRGYGEENDFAMRARAAGWRHVAVPGMFVAHAGEKSFGALAPALRQRAQAILTRLHPTYAGLIARHVASDGLAAARRRFDLARWRDARPRGSRAVLLVTHDHGGGVEKAILTRTNALRDEGVRPILLRPVAPPGTPGPNVRLDDGGNEYPNLRFRLPDELPALLRLLRGDKVTRIEIHHLLGHPPESLQLPALLGVPHKVVVHDYAWFCPRILLCSADGRYCGEPDLAGCVACVKANGSNLDPALSVPALRRQSKRLLAAAERVEFASKDAAARMVHHFPGLRPTLRPPSDDAAPVTMRYPMNGQSRVPVRHVVIVGAIGVEKGFDVLLQILRDAAVCELPLRFTLVGHSIDDAALLATGKIFITGPYRPDEAVTLIRTQQADLAFLPSVWPETWCYTLTEAWEAGLGAVVFDLGAQAERVRATGRGLVLPIGLPAAGINDALLAAPVLAARS